MAYRFTQTGDYYVAINGSDANSGTSPDAPFATIQAAFDAVGSTSSQTIVVGTGIYNEAININGSTGNQYTTLIGDGDVIIHGDGITDDSTNAAFCNGPSYYRSGNIDNITFIGWDNVFTDPQGNQNYFRDGTIRNCTFINNKSICGGAMSNHNYFEDCTFIKTHFPGVTNNRNSLHNTEFRRCIFLKSFLNTSTEIDGIHQSQNVYNQGYMDLIEDCLFANPFDDEDYIAINIPKYDPTDIHLGRFKNIVFSSECKIGSFRDTYRAQSTPERTDITHPFTQSATEFVNEVKQYGTWLAHNGEPMDKNTSTKIYEQSLVLADLSWNAINLTGSTNLFETLGAPYSLDFNNNDYFTLAEHPLFRKIANKIPALGYGTDNSANNVFHTAGGATWDNIIETGSGFIISSSALITGSIESAVIDQGSSKTLQDVQFNWTTNLANQGVISYYTSSEAGFGTPYTYQIRYGDVANLSSEEYKIFPLNDIPYIDANGSGSGDVNFITGSTLSVKGQYLQFKLTLRNNWNG